MSKPILDTNRVSSNGEGELHVEPAAAPPNPFAPDNLRLSQDFNADLGVTRTILNVPVKKPDKSWFVRTHRNEDYRLQTGVLNLKDESEMYLVDRSLWPDLITSEATFTFVALFTAITRQGTVFLWPVGLPGPDGRSNSWNESSLCAATRAMDVWLRVTSNRQAGGYDVCEASVEIPAPSWPKMSFGELLNVAFRDRQIGSLDHPILKKLRGEI